MKIRIASNNGGCRLMAGAESFFINGVVNHGGPIHLLPRFGGNSLRLGEHDLDAAGKNGLLCLVDLPLGKQRQKFDYSSRIQLSRQRAQIREIVERCKDSDGVLMWAIGNEPEIHTTGKQRASLWDEVNRIAEMIKEMDSDHPVITVIGGDFRVMPLLAELDERCPALDAVGINAYEDMLTLPEDLEVRGWSRPYLVTEFGPRGHWQTAKTSWGMPTEDSSTRKAESYLRAYEHAVKDRPGCLGSYAFLWGHKQEKTHTWYGMFLPDGNRTEAVDVMTLMWTGRWPAIRCPRLAGDIKASPEGDGGDPKENIFPPGTRLDCRIDLEAVDAPPPKVEWELRNDVSDHPGVGGDPESPTPPVDGSVLSVSEDGLRAVVRIPETPGPWRIFVYARDGFGGAATANLPILAR